MFLAVVDGERPGAGSLGARPHAVVVETACGFTAREGEDVKEVIAVRGVDDLWYAVPVAPSGDTTSSGVYSPKSSIQPSYP